MQPRRTGARTTSAAEAALATEESRIFVVSMKDPGAGTAGVVTQMRRVDGAMHLIVTGLERATSVSVVSDDPHLLVQVERAPLSSEAGPEVEGAAA